MTEGSSPQTIFEVLGSDHDSLTERLAEPVLVAPGRHRFAAAVSTRITMKLTRAGRRARCQLMPGSLTPASWPRSLGSLGRHGK